jgi:aspartyl-tRNA(Asn)/glutamyl-tRNA(Gln) amidotransferase subunit C
MALKLEDVEHIADLARLDLTGEEKEQFREQLSSILDHIAQLQALDTAAIQPTSSVLPPRSVLRADKPRPGLGIEALMQNAPDQEASQFRVPPVLD